MISVYLDLVRDALYPKKRGTLTKRNKFLAVSELSEMSAEDIMHDPDTLLAAMIIAKQPWDEREKEIQMEQLRRELEERKIRVDGNLFITQDETAFEQIDSMNYSEWTAREEWFSGRCYFAMDQAYEFYYANWR